MNLGPTELIIVLVIVLVLFGGAKLPKLAKSLGEAKREFEKGQNDGSTPNPQAGNVTTPTDNAVPQQQNQDQQGPIS